jgi:hypothetical protein
MSQLVSPFERACWDNDLTKVKELLPSVTDNDLAEGVDAAIARNHIDVINFMLSSGKPLPNLLSVSCYNDSLPMIKLFIDKYELEDNALISVTANTLEFLLPRMKEIPQDYVELVIFSLERDPQKYKPVYELLFNDPRTPFDYDTLVTAISARNEQMACKMLDHGNFTYNNDGYYYNDFKEMMNNNMRDLAYKLVSNCKFDIAFCDDVFDQDQLYHWAFHNGHHDIVEKIELNYPDRTRWT